jgi:hypothetical protein
MKSTHYINVPTYTSDIRVPMIKSQEVLNQCGKNRGLVLSVVVHDLLSQHSFNSLVGRGTIVVDLLVDETVVVGDQLALGNGGVVRGPLAKELHGVTSNSVARVISDRVVVFRSRAVVSLGEIGNIVRVTERTTVNGVVQTSEGLTTEKVVQGAVLHNENDDILDIGFQIFNGRRRVSTRLMGNSTRGGGEGQEANKSTVMHFGRLPGSSLLENMKLPLH